MMATIGIEREKKIDEKREREREKCVPKKKK